MPQLDISFYFSQITWLAISFFSFFCISKWLILPRLDKILANRSNTITTNIDFANKATATADQILKSCEIAVSKKNIEIEQQISNLVANCKKYNDDKLLLLKKELCEKENNCLLQVKTDIVETKEQMNKKIVEIVEEILKEVYIVKNVDKERVNEIFKKLNY